VANYLDTDSDGDGIGDDVEGSNDSDGDGQPNYLDTDADDDGIPDNTEGTDDADGNGTVNYRDTDADGDGIDDSIEGTTDTDGDGDGDYLDTDSDNDGIPDSVEGTGDADDDGTANYLDTDADGDSIPDSTEGTTDTDGDGVANYLDPRDDSDSETGDQDTPQPEIGVERNRAQFGNVSVGETQIRSIVVKNLLTSNRSLVVSRTLITGREPGEFSIVNDSGAPFTLAPGERKRIDVQFSPQTPGEKQAQLRIISNTEVSQIDVWLSNTGAYLVVQEVGIDRDSEDRSVNIDGTLIRENSTYTVNVSRSTLGSRPAKISETNMTVTRAGNFSMNITHSANPLRAGTEIATPERTALQYVSVDYNVPSQTFNETSFVFTVDKSRLPAGTTPDEIAFERHSEGQWREQDVRLIGESDSSYRFHASTSGYEQFVITAPNINETNGEVGEPTGSDSDGNRTDADDGNGGQADCELFGVDLGSFIICWYWWLLAAGIELLLVLYRSRHRGMLGFLFSRRGGTDRSDTGVVEMSEHLPESSDGHLWGARLAIAGLMVAILTLSVASVGFSFASPLYWVGIVISIGGTVGAVVNGTQNSTIWYGAGVASAMIGVLIIGYGVQNGILLALVPGGLMLVAGAIGVYLT